MNISYLGNSINICRNRIGELWQGLKGYKLYHVSISGLIIRVFFDFPLTVKAAPHECVIRTGQP